MAICRRILDSNRRRSNWIRPRSTSRNNRQFLSIRWLWQTSTKWDTNIFGSNNSEENFDFFFSLILILKFIFLIYFKFQPSRFLDVILLCQMKLSSEIRLFYLVKNWVENEDSPMKFCFKISKKLVPFSYNWHIGTSQCYLYSQLFLCYLLFRIKPF